MFAIEPRDMQRSEEHVGGLLALEAGIVARAIAGLMNFVERSCAEKFVVIGERPFVMAECAVGGVEALVVRAAGEAGERIVNDARTFNECAIMVLVTEVGQLGPTRGIGLSNPQVIHGETSSRITQTNAT